MITFEAANEKYRYDETSGMLFHRSGPRAGKPVTSVSNRFYVRCKIGQKSYLAHRIIWLLKTGVMPSLTIDHVDGNKANNRWENLREVSTLDQNKNLPMPRSNKSGVLGVSKNKGWDAWRAQIRSNGRVIKLGDFKNFDDAVAARRKAEVELGYHPNHGRPPQYPKRDAAMSGKAGA